MAKYLKSSPAPIAVRTLADLIAFDKAHAQQEMTLFGQEQFEQAEKTKGLDDPDYKKARQASFQAAGPNGIDRLLKQYKVIALVGPTAGPAWKIDAVNGDQFSGGGAGSLAAVAGYPHLTVPMGLVKGMPVGLSFIGAEMERSDASFARLCLRAGARTVPEFEVLPLDRSGRSAGRPLHGTCAALGFVDLNQGAEYCTTGWVT